MHLARAVVATGITALVLTPLGPAGADAGDATRRPALEQQPAVSLPPVSEHAIDPVILANVPVAAVSSAGQVVELEIVGGDLALDHDVDRVTLAPDGDGRTWTGTLPPVRVVDARGTHAGWRVRWEVRSVTVDGRRVGANVRVDAATPTVVDGLDGGLGAGHGRALGRADRGWGGGTYELGGTITVRLPARVEATTVIVELGYAVA